MNAKEIPSGPDIFAGAGQEKQEKSSMLVHPAGEGGKAGLGGNEMDLGLSGKAGLVAASSRGLGKAIALGLAREGVNVTICARGEETLRKTEQEIQKLGRGQVLAVPADVGLPDVPAHLVKETVRAFGRIDILVTNAGGPPPGPFERWSDEDWQGALDLGLMSVIRFCRAAIPHMKEQGGGRLILMTSSAVKQPIEDLILSNVSRAGVAALAKSLANELAKDHILVNNICPGFILTDRVQELATHQAVHQGISLQEVLKRQVRDIPVGRIGEPEEVANLVSFLASSQGSYITGTTIQVDGGRLRGIF